MGGGGLGGPVVAVLGELMSAEVVLGNLDTGHRL